MTTTNRTRRISTPHVQVEEVTPSLAAHWLEACNSHNRPVKDHSVAAYARDMAKGEWRFTGDGIRFDRDEVLLDGQNRLQAIVRSGVTLHLPIWRGLAPEAQEVMDTGSKRNASDVLALRGEKNTHLLASAAAAVITGCGTARNRVTHAEVISVIENDPSVKWICNEVLPQLKLYSVLSPTVAFYAYWRLHQIDEAATNNFFHSLSSLVGLPSGSPILALHRRLVSHNLSARKSHRYRQEALANIYTAWNAWRAGEQRQRIQVAYVRGGRPYVPEPK
jgi:hypothetical protein